MILLKQAYFKTQSHRQKSLLRCFIPRWNDQHKSSWWWGKNKKTQYLFQNITLVVCCNLNFCTPNDHKNTSASQIVLLEIPFESYHLKSTWISLGLGDLFLHLLHESHETFWTIVMGIFSAVRNLLKKIQPQKGYHYCCWELLKLNM